MVELNSFEIFVGILYLIHSIFNIFLGLMMIKKYFRSKVKELIFMGIAIIIVASTMVLSGAISFILILIVGEGLSNELWFFISVGFVPLGVFCWMIVFTNYVYKKKQKFVLSIIAIWALIYEIIFLFFLFTNTSKIGVKVSPLFGRLEPFFLLNGAVLIIVILITSIFFYLECRRSSDLETRLRGNLFLICFVLCLIPNLILMSQLFFPVPVFFILISFIIITIYILPLYWTFVLPDWLKNIFIKEVVLPTRKNDMEIKKGSISNFFKVFTKPQKITNLIIEHASDLIEIIGNEFEIEFFNAKIHETRLGFTEEEIMEKNMLELIHPDDLNSLLRNKKEFLKKGEFKGDIRYIKKDGNYIWLEYRGKSFNTIENEIKHLLILRDITEHKEYIRKLNEIDELRKDFIIRATHDLKTPITSVYATSKLIADIFTEIPEHHKNILPQEILTLSNNLSLSVSRLKEMAISLLDFSRLESGTFQLNKEMINVSEIIRSCVITEKLLAQERNVEILINLPNSLTIFADKVRLSQVFQNLISNALKNTPMNENIFIDYQKKDNYIRINVRDMGIGLTLEEKNRLFKKFCNIKRDRTDIISEGFGCGLYITKQLVLSHEGKIWANSEGRNKGSIFSVELPIN